MQKTVHLVTFTVELLNRKLHLLCSVLQKYYHTKTGPFHSDSIIFAESPEAPELFCAEFTDKESKCTVQAISMWKGVPFAYEVYWIPTATFPAEYKDMDSFIYKDFAK